MRPYNEIRLGQAHRADVVIGSLCGALLAVLVILDVIERVKEWLLG